DFSGQEGEREQQHQNPHGAEQHRELAPIARRQMRQPSPPPARARVDAHPAIMTSFERAPARVTRRARSVLMLRTAGARRAAFKRTLRTFRTFRTSRTLRE